MRLPFKKVVVAAICLAFLTNATEALPATSSQVNPEQNQPERMHWWHQAHFGMFIHWGVYSEIGKGEWVMRTAKIPLKEYEQLPKSFNPTQFDAAEWVSMAKKAGQKYLVITTKHHDGFCMFDSKYTDYDITSTPFKRDVIKEIADECHRQGIKLGFYYSLLDWHHPDYLPRLPWDDRPTDTADFNRYITYAKNQVRELLTNYGKVDILWFGGAWQHNKDPKELQQFQDIINMARELQPGILVNNRLNVDGDFKTPEQQIPATGLTDDQGNPVMWEACMTMTTGHGSFAPTAWWGYDKYETEYKPTTELVQKLIDLTSKGGNFLLNVGPKPNGKLQAVEVNRLEGIGQWMDKHFSAIYGASASPFSKLPFFGRVTQKRSTLYIHVFSWPENHEITLPGLQTPVQQAYVMGEKSAQVQVEQSQQLHGVTLKVSGIDPDPIADVLVVELDGLPEVAPLQITPDDNGIVHLPAHYAEIHGQHGQRAKPMAQAGDVYIGNWSNPNDVIVWEFTLPKGGRYSIQMNGKASSQSGVGQQVRVQIDNQEVTGSILGYGVQFDNRLKIPAGKHTISVELLDAERTGPPIFDLFGLQLLPS